MQNVIKLGMIALFSAVMLTACDNATDTKQPTKTAPTTQPSKTAPTNTDTNNLGSQKK